jgi:hypothetical protein
MTLDTETLNLVMEKPELTVYSKPYQGKPILFLGNKKKLAVWPAQL